MNANTLSTQPAVPQLGTLSVPQLPLSPQLFPGILMQPPLTLGSGSTSGLLCDDHYFFPEKMQIGCCQILLLFQMQILFF